MAAASAEILQNATQPSLTQHMFRAFHLRGFLRFFYIVDPYETSFATVEQVPNYVDEAMPLFFFLAMVEIVLTKLVKKEHLYDAADSTTSMGAGILQQTVKILTRSAEINLYFYINKYYAIYPLPWNSRLTWILGFLTVDLGYYWFHRAAHEVNLFWAAHQVHHSSEYYNLTTALRQGMIQQFTSFMFYVPFAFFLPSSVHVTHIYLNLLYQFWIHTQMIKSLGPLEYVLNTPSHHRVHHGRNPYCIDKNYDGTLIIWDRMFGTFQAEKEEEPVAYGLIHNIETYNPIVVQMQHLWHIFVEKLPSTSSIADGLKAIFFGPGWFPGMAKRLGEDDFPEVEKPVKVYSQPIPRWTVVYCILQFVLVVAVYSKLIMDSESMTAGLYSTLIATIIGTLYTCGLFFDNKSYAAKVEVARLLFLEIAVVRFGFGSCVHQNMIAHGVLSILIAFWTVVGILGDKRKIE